MGTDAAFATLGIAVGVQPIEITRAFRALSRRSHPDTGGQPAVFATIVAAYRTLQRAGLVRADRSPVKPAPASGVPIGPTGPVPDGGGRCQRSGRVPSSADRHYRRFLDGLDRAAAMPGWAAAMPDWAAAMPEWTSPNADRWIDPPPSRRHSVDQTAVAGATFAEILDRELLRVS